MGYNDDVFPFLTSMVCESNEDVINEMYEKCLPSISFLLKKYHGLALKYGVDESDLQQEAMLAFSKAVNTYDDTKNAKLITFVSLCVERRLQKVINKAKALQDNLSLEYSYDDGGTSFSDFLASSDVSFLDGVYFERLVSCLSSFELDVFNCLKKDLKYKDIAKLLDKSPKQIDNTIQRIKNKARVIFKEDNDEREV